MYSEIALRNCAQIRDRLFGPDDVHLSAFPLFEPAADLLMRDYAALFHCRPATLNLLLKPLVITNEMVNSFFQKLIFRAMGAPCQVI